MKIIYLPENTGSGAIPRNVGLEHARGKYVYFVDSDDLIIDDTLETLYNFAENYQAQIVYMEKGFHCGEEIVPQTLTEVSWNPPQFISSAPQFEDKDIFGRIDRVSKRSIAVTTCTKFLRRDFLIDNAIKFPNLKPAEDVIWTIKLICSAKKILRVQNPLYVYRINNNSVTGKKRSPEQKLAFWLNSLVKGMTFLEEFMREQDFFEENPACRLQIMHFFAKIQFDFMEEAFQSLKPYEIYEIFQRDLSNMENVPLALISYLLITNNLYRNELIK